MGNSVPTLLIAQYILNKTHALLATEMTDMIIRVSPTSNDTLSQFRRNILGGTALCDWSRQHSKRK